MSFQPNVGQIIVGAFDRIEVRQTEITAAHMAAAYREANLLQVQWGNKGPNLWTVGYDGVSLVAGQQRYSIPTSVVDVLDVYLELGTFAQGALSPDLSFGLNASAFSSNDRILTSLGRSEYLQIPNKTQSGQPTSYWFEKGLTPLLNLWPVPDQAYQLAYWYTQQIQDAAARNAGMPNIPYLWLDAFSAGLAHRLARIYARPLMADCKVDADEAWQIAANQDVENVPIYICPNTSGYYR